MPPPRVSPTAPVWLTKPPVAASPKAWLSRSRWALRAPPSSWTVRATGSTRAPVIADRSMTSAVVEHGVAGDRVAAAADGRGQVVVAGVPDGGHHVGHPPAPGDGGRATVDLAVPDAAGVVVRGWSGTMTSPVRGRVERLEGTGVGCGDGGHGGSPRSVVGAVQSRPGAGDPPVPILYWYRTHTGPNVGAMTTTYGQFCPVAMASEVLTERWTPLVVRELLCGSTRFNDLRRGVPLMSPALLSKRLKTLERVGVVEKRGATYHLTPAGEELRAVIESMGVWGQRWARGDVVAKHFDASLLMWDIHRNVVVRGAAGPERVVVHFHLRGSSDKKSHFWLVLEPRPSTCASPTPVTTSTSRSPATWRRWSTTGWGASTCWVRCAPVTWWWRDRGPLVAGCRRGSAAAPSRRCPCRRPLSVARS